MIFENSVFIGCPPDSLCKAGVWGTINNFKTQKFLNSFFSLNHRKNKNNQIKNLKKFIRNWNGQQNLIFISHYVVIKEVLDINASSGEIIVADLNYKMINRIQIGF